MEIFEKNIAAIEQRYELLAEKIRKIDIDMVAGRMGIEMAANGLQIPWVKSGKRIWRLNSRQNPQEAAEIYADRYQIRMYGIYFIFGFSDGRSVREFLKKCDDTNLIVICEPDLELFAMNCHYFEISDIIQEKNVIPYFTELEHDMDAFLSKIIDYTRIKLLEFCILPGYDVLHNELCENFMDGVVDRIRNELVNKSTGMAFERLIPQHTLYHMKNMIYHKNIEQLRLALEKYDLLKIPCIIVSAGPSLDKNVHLLRQAQGKAFIVVVDAALRTVLKAGVRPDLVCTVDAKSPERFFEGVDLRDIVWAYTRTTRKSIAENYGKDVFYYGAFYHKWNETIKEQLGYPIPSFPSGGSVSCEAFVIGLYLGFRTVILIGQDLAFTGGLSHTKEVVGMFGDNNEYIKGQKLVEVESIDGTMLNTDFQMWCYKKWFEKVIKINQDQIKVIDATEGGAKIEGTIIQTFAETIKQECGESLDFYEIEKQIPAAFSLEQQVELLGKLREIKDEVEEFSKKVDAMIEWQESLLTRVEVSSISKEDLLKELKDISMQYEKIDQETILDFISMYAHKEEYELGDQIYTEEKIEPKDLLKKGLSLYKGYQKGVKMLTEDIEEILMKD
ncbi:MAG: DUF115 domain-containing protein [Thermoflexaceae bacterium]|nr:DUF115 domain-containing protein [Thermoflexaceae bacterium]